jgi:hypothetical protein
LEGKPQGKRALGRSGRRWDIKMDLRETLVTISTEFSWRRIG